MSKLLYLHMGFHKTGSSSLQYCLSENIKNLQEQCVTYPLFDCTFVKGINGNSKPLYNIHNHGVCLKYIFSSNSRKNQSIYWNIPEDCIDKVKDSFLEQLDNVLNNNDKVILSGEDISYFSENELYKFKSYILEKNFKIMPIIVVKSPYGYLISLLQQQIKVGKYFDLTNIKEYSSFFQKTKIDTIKKVFYDNNPIFISYTKAIRDNIHGTVEAVVDTIGVSIKYSSDSVINSSYNNKRIRYQNILNEKEPYILNNKLNKQHTKVKEIENDNEKFMLTKYELSTIIDILLEENKYYLKELGDNFCDIDYPTCD